MQIESIASSIATQTVAASAQVTSHGKSQTVDVEHTPAGYEVYLPGQPGPVATAASADLAEALVNSTVQFQA